MRPVLRSTNARTFAVSARAQRLVADPSGGRHVFHLALETAPGEPALDHYVVIEWSGDERMPSIRWFVDARSFSELRPRLGAIGGSMSGGRSTSGMVADAGGGGARDGAASGEGRERGAFRAGDAGVG
ncbi:MAG: hypothetical protein R3F65_09440 [bacterium]